MSHCIQEVIADCSVRFSLSVRVQILLVSPKKSEGHIVGSVNAAVWESRETVAYGLVVYEARTGS
jgi:hypothetical protein